MNQIERSIASLIANTPFDEGMLTDRDYFGQDWAPVLDTPERFLMMWGVDVRDLHLMWLNRRDGFIVQAQQVPSTEVETVYDRHGRHLLPEERQVLEEILQIGMSFPEHFVDALGRNQWHPPLMNYNETDADGWTVWFQTLRPPTRCAEVLLEALVDASGHLLEWQLIEGAAQRKQVLWCRSRIYKQQSGRK